MGISVFKGDRGSAEVRFCLPWLRAASKLRQTLYADGEGFDPFSYNETAAVGHLVSAAGRAGYLALPEFTENNRRLPAGRYRAGRCDLWLASPEQDVQWLMEFKLCKLVPGAKKGLITPINEAMQDVFDRDRQEAQDRWGCVIYCLEEPWETLDQEAKDEFQSLGRLEVLADYVDLAFRFNDDVGPAYLLMKRLPELARKAKPHMVPKDALADA